MGMATYARTPTASVSTSGTITLISIPVRVTYSLSSASQPWISDPEEWAQRLSSREAFEKVVKLSRRKRPSPSALCARHGFQQMARIPCYRSTRTR